MKKRIKVTDSNGNLSYLTKNDKNVVFYFNKSMTPLCLSGISSNGAELQFALEDCKTAEEMLKICKIKMNYAKTVELF